MNSKLLHPRGGSQLARAGLFRLPARVCASRPARSDCPAQDFARPHVPSLSVGRLFFDGAPAVPMISAGFARASARAVLFVSSTEARTECPRSSVSNGQAIRSIEQKARGRVRRRAVAVGESPAPNTPSGAVIQSLGSEAVGEPKELPTPGRFAGLENREEVIAKPCLLSMAEGIARRKATNCDVAAWQASGNGETAPGDLVAPTVSRSGQSCEPQRNRDAGSRPINDDGSVSESARGTLVADRRVSRDERLSKQRSPSWPSASRFDSGQSSPIAMFLSFFTGFSTGGQVVSVRNNRDCRRRCLVEAPSARPASKNFALNAELAMPHSVAT